MRICDEETGFTIDLTYDEDGFPLVSINTGGGFYAENFRPTVKVMLNDVIIHNMFLDKDERWLM